MTRSQFYAEIEATLDQTRRDGLYKEERFITSPQGSNVDVEGSPGMVNLCSNNYLGLADHPEIIAAAGEAMSGYGYGMASVRFICGTLDIHRTLEQETSAFMGTEDSITFASCFDANGAVFEPLLGENDAIVSDSLNHASIIDGVRLCKAKRYRYETRNMADLEAQLKQARSDDARHILIVTDGVFSMDGFIADIASICEIADVHDALVMVDDCHATGFIGPRGRGTPALHGVSDRVDIITSTFGKALGGGMGGFIAGRSAMIDLLRQRARPYLFSNALAPPLVGGARQGLRLADGAEEGRRRIQANAEHFRAGLNGAGFTLSGAGHPIIPVMVGDAEKAAGLAADLLRAGIFVTAFSFPVVPRGSSRIRTQVSAAHSEQQLDTAIEAFTKAGRAHGVIPA